MTQSQIVDLFTRAAAILRCSEPNITFATEPKLGDEQATATAIPTGDPLEITFWPPFFDLSEGVQGRIIRHELRMLEISNNPLSLLSEHQIERAERGLDPCDEDCDECYPPEPVCSTCNDANRFCSLCCG